MTSVWVVARTPYSNRFDSFDWFAEHDTAAQYFDALGASKCFSDEILYLAPFEVDNIFNGEIVTDLIATNLETLYESAVLRRLADGVFAGAAGPIDDLRGFSPWEARPHPAAQES